MRVALTAAAIAAFVTASGVHAQPTVYLHSESQTVTAAKLADAAPAFQWAVSRDFAPVWGTDATLTTTRPVPGDWPITVTDTLAPCDLWGCVLGYHGVTTEGVPYAVIYATASALFNTSWQTVLSHELFEMLADPYGDRSSLSRKTFSILEVCDPVSEWSWSRPSATGKRVRLSDFVTPAWFRKGARGPYDLQRRLVAPLQLGGGGYRSVWDPVSNTWETIL